MKLKPVPFIIGTNFNRQSSVIGPVVLHRQGMMNVTVTLVFTYKYEDDGCLHGHFYYCEMMLNQKTAVTCYPWNSGKTKKDIIYDIAIVLQAL